MGFWDRALSAPGAVLAGGLALWGMAWGGAPPPQGGGLPPLRREPLPHARRACARVRVQRPPRRAAVRGLLRVRGAGADRRRPRAALRVPAAGPLAPCRDPRAP